MARESYIQSSFTGGELSPLMLGRVDLDRRKTGLSTCFNSLPYVQGGWTRRPGTVFLKTTKYGSARESRLFPFEYTDQQAYVLEVGHEYIRFFTLQGVLTETAQDIEDVSQADPGVVTLTGHGYSDGERLHVYNMTGAGMHQLDGREVIVANKTADTFELKNIYSADIDTSGYDAYTSGGKVAKIIEVVTTYDEDYLDYLQVAQSTDTLYLFNPYYGIRKLVREDATTWTLSAIDFVDGPYLAENQTTTTLTPSATTGAGITITASAVTGINNDQGFLSTDVGRYVRAAHGSTTWGYAKITAITDTTHVTATVVNDFGAATAVTKWRLGLWSGTTGYPAAGEFHEDRLAAGGCPAEPQRIDMSKTALHENMQPSDVDGTVADDNAVEVQLKSKKAHPLKWLSSDSRGLLAGTAGGEWIIRPSSLGEAITPTNRNAKESTHYGSEAVPPIVADESVVFVQRAGRKMRELVYVFERDGFSAPDMTLLSEHVTQPSILGATYQQQPQPLIWSWRSDGVLLGTTYAGDQKIVGWHRHELGGPSDADGTHALVKSAATIPAPSGDRDETYVITERYINGQTERYVELISKVWETNDQSEDAFYVDCGLTEIDEASGLSEVTGLWHLEGETLSVWADGAGHPECTVTNGKVNLNNDSYTIVTLGYGYNSDGEMLPIEAGATDGTAQGKIKRIPEISFWILDTLGLQYGPDEDTLTEFLVRQWGASYGVATPLYTGVLRGRFEGDYDRLGQVYWRASTPAPCNVLAVMPVVYTEED